MITEGRLIENKALQETLHFYRVDPGMDVYVLPRPGYRKKYAIFSTRFGSVDNRFRIAPHPEITELPDGVAHFLEHKLFEDEKGSVFDRFAALGASANAYTSFTQTTYLFSATANFEQCLRELLDFVQQPYFTAETVAKEQGIIGQEIKMYDDHPQWRVFFNLLEALYHEHPVRNDIAGSLESIARITPELLYRCYETFYHPSNMAVFVVGDLDPERVAEDVAANLFARRYKPQGRIERLFPQEPEEVRSERVEQEFVVSEPVCYLGFKDRQATGLEGPELLRREILMELALDIIFGTSEPLYNDLYRENLIDENFGAEYNAELGFAYTMVGGETRDPGLLGEKITSALEKAGKEGFNAGQFERHRRKLLGGYIRRFNSLEFIANNFLAYRFKDSDLFALPAILAAARPGEAADLVAENLDPSRMTRSLIFPAPAS